MAVGKKFRHIDEIYKRRLLAQETPRRGDLACVVRDHHRNETGMLVKVVNDPHECEARCHECGQMVYGFFVEVVPSEPILMPGSALVCPGPYFMPLDWLRRANPH